MNPEQFFSMTSNPNHEIGHGKRGLRSITELSEWSADIVKLHCFTCFTDWDMTKTSWLNNIPLECPNCSNETLAHEYMVPDAFTQEQIKPSGIIQQITEPFRRACIVRYVKTKSF
jgi:hypothetical protein